MKYIFSILVIFTLLMRPLSAQEISFGAVAGPNFSTFTFSSETYGAQFRIAFYAGLVMKLDLSEKWAIRPEFQYSQQGITLRDGDAKVKKYNNYFTIPMLMQYSPNENISILFGPGIGILLKAVEINEYPGGYHDEVDAMDEYNKVDVGLNLGFEYHLNTKLSIGLRYYNAIMNANIPYKYKNANISIPVTYMF